MSQSKQSTLPWHVWTKSDFLEVLTIHQFTYPYQTAVISTKVSGDIMSGHSEIHLVSVPGPNQPQNGMLRHTENDIHRSGNETEGCPDT